MPLDTPVPLATAGALSAGAFADLVKAYDDIPTVLMEATRACETECNRRLTPFTITETHRAEGIDPDEYGSSNVLMDTIGSIGSSYQQSLGGSEMVRHVWLNEYAPLFQEMWTYSNVSVTIQRSIGGSELLGATAGQFVGPEPDTGHLLLNLGKFVPIGSQLRITYSGGYTTVPADLGRACKWMAAAIICREIDPMGAQHQHSPAELESLAVSWLGPYVRS